MYIKCPSCYGTGVYDVDNCEDGIWGECPECQGSGEVEE